MKVIRFDPEDFHGSGIEDRTSVKSTQSKESFLSGYVVIVRDERSDDCGMPTIFRRKK
jgi:hypothetical protein